ncbi:phosphatidylserine decarboxylase proenzyme [Sporosarcina sp. NCCP-2222]|uniref:phosphatidylserine decarboxylase n=1 Tax=Sporosarcina sp. NCCP-2222 TaxID=2935073 RepID=UPI00207F7F28|nr:phosphatidylserine decarboxylase [Sporosarcina sp. NCCP-2222]GKV54534.1 phosphatidylserine decarboxylase proenzyme [Sporosarcina sp. NCCP-2222]
MKRTLFKYFVELTGHPVSSTLLKSISQSPLSRPLIKPFAKAYGINESEAEYAIETYGSLQAYFTRNLKQGVRNIEPAPNILVSPVDGVLSAAGKVEKEQTFLIKDYSYSIKQILGDEKIAKRYENGYYCIFYLSPSHYHHFHYPIDGNLLSRYALGTVSYPVNNLGLRLGDRPFATNYRLISELETAFGQVAIVKVGALNVNSIHIQNHTKNCVKGEDFGYFSFGSTVILFIEQHESFQLLQKPATNIMMGESIGIWT